MAAEGVDTAAAAALSPSPSDGGISLSLSLSLAIYADFSVIILSLLRVSHRKAISRE